MRRQILATKKLNILHPDKQPTLYMWASKQAGVDFSALNMQFSALVNIFLRANYLFFCVQRLYSLVRPFLGLSRNAWEKALPNDNSNDGDYKLAKSSVSFKCTFVISVRSRGKVSITLCSWLLHNLLSINAYYVY